MLESPREIVCTGSKDSRQIWHLKVSTGDELPTLGDELTAVVDVRVLARGRSDLAGRSCTSPDVACGPMVGWRGEPVAPLTGAVGIGSLTPPPRTRINTARFDRGLTALLLSLAARWAARWAARLARLAACLAARSAARNSKAACLTACRFFRASHPRTAAWRRLTALLFFRELTLRGFVPAFCSMARHCLAVAARRAASRASHSASASPSAIAGAHTSHSRAHVAVLGSRLPWQGASPFSSDNLGAAEFGFAGNIQGGDMHFGRGRGTSSSTRHAWSLTSDFKAKETFLVSFALGLAIFFLSTLRFRGTRIQPSLLTLVDISFALTCLCAGI